MSRPASSKVLSSFALSMISVSAIINMREFPVMASIGLQSLFFYSLALVLFLLPSAFVCAELATAMPENGGIYTWTRKAFGEKVGFIAIWMEWFNNVISFPASLATIVATIAYITIPSLHNDKLMLFVIMMTIYWGLTFFNLLGIKTSSRLNILGAILGTIIPTLFIIALGIVWISTSHHLALTETHLQVIPPMHMGSLSFLVGVLSAYAGMQITGFHAQNVKNPQRSFPRAIFTAVLMIFLISVTGTLAITFVIPAAKIGYLIGVVEALTVYLDAFHLKALIPIFAGAMVLASLASLNAWMAGPARGLHNAALHGQLPKMFTKSNVNEMPTNILIMQGFVGTLLATIFLFAPTMKTAFWVLITLTSQFTVFIFILLFASVIKLRYSFPDMSRPYRIPGGNPVLWVICCAAISLCAVSFVLALFPPLQIHIIHPSLYMVFMLVGDAIIISIPLLWLWRLKYTRSD